MSRRLVLATTVCAVSATASAVYAIVYLYRWEFHRALVALGFLIATEIPLATLVLVARMARVERKVDQLASQPMNDIAELLRESPPPKRHNFAWLRRSGTDLQVFVPLLLGMGTLLSGVAWLIDQIARRVGASFGDRRLARRLSVLSLPIDGFVPHRAQSEGE